MPIVTRTAGFSLYDSALQMYESNFLLESNNILIELHSDVHSLETEVWEKHLKQFINQNKEKKIRFIFSDVCEIHTDCYKIYKQMIKNLNINPNHAVYLINSARKQYITKTSNNFTEAFHAPETRQLKDTIFSYDANFEFVNFFMLYVLNMTRRQYKLIGVDSDINRDSVSNKGLFFVGKIGKRHRIRVLAELYKQNMLKDIDYSCLTTNGADYNLVSDMFSLAEYNQFINDIPNKLDDCNVQIKNNKGGMHADGFPYDINLLNKAKFMIISETDNYSAKFNNDILYRNYVWITEKFYKAIIHKMPFALVATEGTFKYLTDQGYQMFHPEIKDSMHFEKDFAREVQTMLNTDLDNRIAESNFNLFMEQALNSENELKKIINNLFKI
jgi:hypothetical protein